MKCSFNSLITNNLLHWDADEKWLRAYLSMKEYYIKIRRLSRSGRRRPELAQCVSNARGSKDSISNVAVKAGRQGSSESQRTARLEGPERRAFCILVHCVKILDNSVESKSKTKKDTEEQSASNEIPQWGTARPWFYDLWRKKNVGLLKRLMALTAYEKQMQVEANMSVLSSKDGSLSCLIGDLVWALNICHSWL